MLSYFAVCLVLGLVLPCSAVPDQGDVAIDKCDDVTSFRCDETQCIDVTKRCNGISECRNGWDESVNICGCQPGEFQCNVSFCIDLIKHCDRISDCGNGVDETGCETHLCPPSHVKCDNHFCIPRDFLCDFKDDCGDNSDEESCPVQMCYGSQWTCDNGQCIANAYLCDGQEDCYDKSDERDCDSHVLCENGLYVSSDHRCDGWIDCFNSQEDEIGCTCDVTRDFLCPNKRCLRNANVCDGVCDCGDTCEDEMICEDVPCLAANRFICKSTNRCILREYVCDGINDCKDNRIGHDEELCLQPGEVCASLDMLCSDGKCLQDLVPSFNASCDYTPDCTDREDEAKCAFPACPHNMYRCDNSQCIRLHMVCDGHLDCLDMSDETNCEQHICSKGQFKCSISGQCIQQDKLCDYHKDCMDGSDEEQCYNPVCRQGDFNCTNGQCIPASHQCLYSRPGVGEPGCSDLSHLMHCKNFSCPPGYFKCRQSYCIPEWQKCDGTIDCKATYSDEALCSWEYECPYDLAEEKASFNGVEKKPKCKCFDMEMNCEDRGFHEIPDMSQEPMYKLRFSGNMLNFTLSQDTFHPWSHFTYLDISNNSITHLGSGYFITLWLLSTLNLADNQIATLNNGTFLGLGRVQTLYLDGNRISDIEPLTFLGMSSLSVLDLSHQRITNIPQNAFSGLRMLRNLDLSYNRISSVYDGAFNGLPALMILDISHNQIGAIGDNVFNGLPALEILRTDEFRFCCLTPVGPTCTPEPDEFSSCEDLMSNYVLRICIWVLGLLSLFGNTLVIYWRMRDTRDSKVHSFLITNLAIGDMLMGVYLLIIASVDLNYRGVYIIYDLFWRHSGLCKFAGFLSTYSSELSVLTLTVITIDRFISIIFPFRIKRMSMRDARIVMATLWGLVFALAAIPLMDIPYFDNFYGRSGVCLALHITPEKSSGWQYSIFVFLALNFVSFLCIFLSYMWMFVIARRTRAAARSPQMKTDRAMARRMTLIVLTDFCCWVPIIGLGIASLCGANIPPQVFAWIAVFVLPLNSAINPLLYTLSTAPFLGHAKNRAFKFRKSFMSSLNPNAENTTKGTTLSATEDRCSPGNDWARTVFKSNKRCYKSNSEALYMYPVVAQHNRRNGGCHSNERETRKMMRHDSSISVDYTRTDIICGYESDQ